MTEEKDKVENEENLPEESSEESVDQNPKWTNLPTVSFRKLQRKTLGQILVESETLTEEHLQDALERQKGSESEKLGEILVENEYISEEDMLRALAYQLDLPYYNRLPVNDIDASLIEEIPIQFCRDNQILPVDC